MSENPAFRLLIVGIRWPAETFIMRLIRGLTDAGVEVTVASSDVVVPGPEYGGRLRWLPTPVWTESGPLRLLRLGAMAARAAVSARQDLPAFGRSAAAERILSRKLRRWYQLLPFAGCRPDAIYFPWNATAITYLPLFDLGCPVILSCRGSQVNVAPSNPRRAGIADGLRETFARARAVHCVSEDILHEAQQFGLDPAKARVIRPAVDPSRFCPGDRTRKAGGVFRVVSTGSLVWCKGYEYGLRAMRLLMDRGVPIHYEIVGDGDNRQRVLYTVHDLGLQDCVTLWGKLKPDDVLARLQAADAFLLPSLSEGISNAALEAMACGLSVVTTDCGGMREAVTDGVEGFVTPVRAPAAMAAALARLAEDAALRARMGRAGRERVEREFSLERQVEAWIGLFRCIGAAT